MKQSGLGAFVETTSMFILIIYLISRFTFHYIFNISDSCGAIYPKEYFTMLLILCETV